MLRASVFLCVLVAASGQADTGECVATSHGRSTCPGADQTTLLQGRVHLALEAEAGSALEKKEAATGFKNDMLQQHNLYRCMHNVPLFTWSDAIAGNAQKYADSTGGRMKHSSRASRQNVGGFRSLGENLADTGGGSHLGGVRRWYAEIKNTNKGLVSSFGGGTGHYTQIVWKSSTAIGCGTSGSLLVCQYGPPGNFQGQFDKQVNGPVKSKAACQPRNLPVPASCVDKDPTDIKYGRCGRLKYGRVLLRCKDHKAHCAAKSFASGRFGRELKALLWKQCCRTCTLFMRPAPTPAPRPTPLKPASVGQITSCSFEDAQLPYCKMWSQTNGDQFDWSRGSRTPSLGTGPSRAKDGKKFLYIETSGGPKGIRAGNKAILRSELVSIRSGASVSFNYHMFGVPDWLRMIVTSQQKPEQVWAQKGNKGNSWQAATVSLKKYAGKDVQIDFVGSKGHGINSYMGDIAIDNVVLDRGAPTPATTPAPPASSNPAVHAAVKALTKQVNGLESKIDVLDKKVR